MLQIITFDKKSNRKQYFPSLYAFKQLNTIQALPFWTYIKGMSVNHTPSMKFYLITT